MQRRDGFQTGRAEKNPAASCHAIGPVRNHTLLPAIFFRVNGPDPWVCKPTISSPIRSPRPVGRSKRKNETAHVCGMILFLVVVVSNQKCDIISSLDRCSESFLEVGTPELHPLLLPADRDCCWFQARVAKREMMDGNVGPITREPGSLDVALGRIVGATLPSECIEARAANQRLTAAAQRSHSRGFGGCNVTPQKTSLFPSAI